MPDLLTDDQRDLVSEVREALSKAVEAQRRIEADKGRLRLGASQDAAVLHEFRDRAPEWLAALCEQVERLRNGSRCPECSAAAWGELTEMRQRAEKAEAAVERVRVLAAAAYLHHQKAAAKAILAALDGE